VTNWEDAQRRVLQAIRCITTDGRAFSDTETVFNVGDKNWQGFANMVHRPTDGALFLFAWAEYPGKLHVYRSDDGDRWELLTEEAYIGHDAMCVTWHAPSGRFINYQTVTQPYPKRYPDNIGELRRVLSFMRSTDGVMWERFSPPFLNGPELWEPGVDDPADLEFYRCVVFPHLGRFAMLLADYVPPPSEANSRRAITKHGPSYMAEWAISQDGLDWQRPFRDTNAYEEQFWLALQGPLVREGRLRFYHPDGRISSLPEDRIFYVTCRANGEFSTHPFTMPAGGLALNAYARYREAERPHGQAYIMAELLNADGTVRAGYERTRCLFEDRDVRRLPLVWKGDGDAEARDGTEFAGQQCRLRFFLRDARIYGVYAR
jgi:hypothetical protein